MGEVSVIARRLEDGKVQYGWGGDDGEFVYLGARLLYWYNDPEMVEYLFSLGQFRLVWEPHSETWEWRTIRTRPIGKPHWVGNSERDIFSQDPLNDVGYFYDLDNTWYYVVCHPFRIKIPMTLMENCTDAHQDASVPEEDFLQEVSRRLAETVRDRYDKDEEFRAYLTDKGYDREKFMADMDAVLHREEAASWQTWQDCAYLLWKHHRSIFDYFDDWAVVVPNEDDTKIRDILLRKKALSHVETLEWKED